MSARVKKPHGTRPCDNHAPHQAHRFNRRTNTWDCLGVKEPSAPATPPSPLDGWCNHHQTNTCGDGTHPSRHNHLEPPAPDWWAANPDAWVVLVGPAAGAPDTDLIAGETFAEWYSRSFG